MNTTVDVSAAMGQDTTIVQSHGAGYPNDQWASISPCSQSPYGNSPMNEYSAFGGYLPHGLPPEPLGRMPPPPPQPQPHHQLLQSAPPMGHHQLPMLNTQWPSQLTNPTPPGSYSAPPLLSMAPSATLPSVPERPKLPVYEKARKTLSAEQKRAMCKFHEENPGTRQADIGLRFGVERSTVSKVLRHKDQYLKRDQEQEQAAIKRAKGKHPDFDRTLSNYVRRQQQRGFEVKDEEIMEQAKLFAHGSGNQEGLLTSLTSSWLQKFKQKHGIGAGRLMRRASETNIPDSITMSTAPQGSFSWDSTSNVISPISPTLQLSPLSGSRSDEDLHADGLDFDFSYRQTGSQSSTSLTSDLQDNSATFSGETISPEGTFNFSPDPNTGVFPMNQNGLHLHPEAPDFHYREKRSNTFPSINIDYANQVTSMEPITPRQPLSATASSALESPSNEVQATPFSIDTTLTASPPTLRRSSSSSSIAARSNNTPADSSPTSPTAEDARRAANTLLSYIQHMTSQFDHSDYIAIAQLTKKLQIHQHQVTRPSIGGLSRIPEGDGEMQALPRAVMDAN